MRVVALKLNCLLQDFLINEICRLDPLGLTFYSDFFLIFVAHHQQAWHSNDSVS